MNTSLYSWVQDMVTKQHYCRGYARTASGHHLKQQQQRWHEKGESGAGFLTPGPVYPAYSISWSVDLGWSFIMLPLRNKFAPQLRCQARGANRGPCVMLCMARGKQSSQATVRPPREVPSWSSKCDLSSIFVLVLYAI